MTPARGAVISTVALSVRTSTMGWSAVTVWPSVTSHFVISPSVRPSPMSGSLNSNAMGVSACVSVRGCVAVRGARQS